MPATQTSEQAATEFADLAGRMKAALGDGVFGVRVSDRLTTSAASVSRLNDPLIALTAETGRPAAGAPGADA